LRHCVSGPAPVAFCTSAKTARSGHNGAFPDPGAGKHDACADLKASSMGRKLAFVAETALGHF